MLAQKKKKKEKVSVTFNTTAMEDIQDPRCFPKLFGFIFS